MTDDRAHAAAAIALTASPSLRASDADRHATVEVVQDAVARGLLTTDEGSERMAAAYAARHVHDLPPLTADLPPAPAHPAPAAVAPGWRPLAGQAWAQGRASVAALAAGGLRSPRTVAILAGVLLALLVVVFLGASSLHLLFPDTHGHGSFPPHR
jgi:hypothetical protein